MVVAESLAKTLKENFWLVASSTETFLPFFVELQKLWSLINFNNSTLSRSTDKTMVLFVANWASQIGLIGYTRKLVLSNLSISLEIRDSNREASPFENLSPMIVCSIWAWIFADLHWIRTEEGELNQFKFRTGIDWKKTSWHCIGRQWLAPDENTLKAGTDFRSILLTSQWVRQLH